MIADAYLTINEALTISFALIAIVVSVGSAYYSHRAAMHSSRFFTIGHHYDAFSELSKVRLDNWLMSHLFETPANYGKIRKTVHVVFKSMPPSDKHALLLKERACAAIVFTHYESTLYQLQAAREAYDDSQLRFLQEIVTYFTTSLLLNPRLMHLWSIRGGNMQEFFEEPTRRHYNEHVKYKPDVSQQTVADVTGPFEEQEDGM